MHLLPILIIFRILLFRLNDSISLYFIERMDLCLDAKWWLILCTWNACNALLHSDSYSCYIYPFFSKRALFVFVRFFIWKYWESEKELRRFPKPGGVFMILVDDWFEEQSLNGCTHRYPILFNSKLSLCIDWFRSRDLNKLLYSYDSHRSHPSIHRNGYKYKQKHTIHTTCVVEVRDAVALLKVASKKKERERDRQQIGTL